MSSEPAGPVLSPDNEKLMRAAMARCAEVLTVYWAHHGKPKTLAQRWSQAQELVTQLYGPSYPDLIPQEA